MNEENVRYAIWIHIEGNVDSWDLNLITNDLKIANQYYEGFHSDNKDKPIHKRLTILLKSNDDYR